MTDLRGRVRASLTNAYDGGYGPFVLGDVDTVAADLLDCDGDLEGEQFELVRPFVAEWQADARALLADVLEEKAKEKRAVLGP